MPEVSWQQFFGFGDSVTTKVYVQAIDSNQTLAPLGQFTKVQPSTSSGLVIGILTLPWTGFSGTIQLMANSSSTAAYNVSSSVASGNIQKGVSLQTNQPVSMVCDGLNWWAIGPSSSN